MLLTRKKIVKDVLVREYRMFEAENQEPRRIGFDADALARIAVLRKAWESIRKSVDDLGIHKPYPAMKRNRREGLWTNESVFDEESGSIYQVDVKIDDATYVHVKDKTKRNWSLSMEIDSANFSDIRVTFNRAHRLVAHELIEAGDFIPVTTNLRPDRLPVNNEWIGQQFDIDSHGTIMRRVPPTIETLTLPIKVTINSL